MPNEEPNDAPVLWAQGVLAERLDITVGEADRMLREHAQRTGRALPDVAHDVVHAGLLVDPGHDR